MPTVTAEGPPLGDKLNDRLGDRLRRWRRTRATELVRQETGAPRTDVRVVTDSTAYLPVSVVEQHGIEVIPLHVVVGGQELVEGRDITAAQVAAALREYTIVTTSRPSPAVFAEVYARLVEEGGIVAPKGPPGSTVRTTTCSPPRHGSRVSSPSPRAMSRKRTGSISAGWSPASTARRRCCRGAAPCSST